MVFLSLEVLPVRPGRRGHSLGEVTSPRPPPLPPQASFCKSPRRAFAHIWAERPGATEVVWAPFQVLWTRFSPLNVRTVKFRPAFCPLGKGGGRQPWGWERGGRDRGVSAHAGMGQRRHSDRGRGSLRPCQSKPARSALLPLSFLKPVLGSSNALKGPGKLSTAPDQTTGRHADCFCFVLVFLSPLLQVKRSCQSRSHPGARRESAEPVFLESALPDCSRWTGAGSSGA